MKRSVTRSYHFTDRDVNEALVEWLRAKELPTPEYVGDAGTTKWLRDAGGVRVEWVEQDDVD